MAKYWNVGSDKVTDKVEEDQQHMKRKKINWDNTAMDEARKADIRTTRAAKRSAMNMSNLEKTGVLAMTAIIIVILASVISSREEQPTDPLTPDGPGNKVRAALKEKNAPWPVEPMDKTSLLLNEKTTDKIFNGKKWPGADKRKQKRQAPKPIKKAPEYRTYVIKDGDILSRISARFLGTSTRWEEIKDLNPGINPTNLKPGTTIKLPHKRQRT